MHIQAIGANMNTTESQTTKIAVENRPLRFSEAGLKTLAAHDTDMTPNALAEMVHAMRFR